MKNINKFLSYTLVLGLVCSLFSACSSDDKENENVALIPQEKFDTKIYFVSNLKNEAIGNSQDDYKPIEDFLVSKGKTGSWLTIVDRTDAEYAKVNMKNYGVEIADKSDLYSTLALNKFENGKIEGSMLYFPKYFQESTSYKVSNDCYVKAVNLPMRGLNTEIDKDINFNVVFRTARFSTEEHVSNFSKEVFPIIKAGKLNMLMVGTVKKELINQFKDGVNKVDSDFEVTIVQESLDNDYAIFVLGFKYMWGLKNANKQNLSSDINLYTLSFMW